MLSHTVPKKLLEHFSYEDPVTRSRRLWRYQKRRVPYGRAALKHATSWDSHFADPTNKDREAAIELRLKREFEDPVNRFIDLLSFETFAFTAEQRRLLTGYITMLFHRTCARRDATPDEHEKIMNAFRSLRANEERLTLLAAKQTMDLIPQGLNRMVTRDEVISAIDNTIRSNPHRTAHNCVTSTRWKP